MRDLILKMSISVDGFVSGPNGEMDWMFKSRSDEGISWIVDGLWQAGVHIMGSRTYYDMAAYWPTSTEPLAAPMNEIPKVIFSKKPSLLPLQNGLTTQALKDATRVKSPSSNVAQATSLVEASWRNPIVAHGDVSEEITRLKAQPGKPILAHGGASFARSLAAHGLIDEYRLVIHPVALGRGLALFSGLPQPLDFRLVSVKSFASGVVAHVYRTA